MQIMIPSGNIIVDGPLHLDNRFSKLASVNASLKFVESSHPFQNRKVGSRFQRYERKGFENAGEPNRKPRNILTADKRNPHKGSSMILVEKYGFRGPVYRFSISGESFYRAFGRISANNSKNVFREEKVELASGFGYAWVWVSNGLSLDKWNRGKRAFIHSECTCRGIATIRTAFPYCSGYG